MTTDVMSARLAAMTQAGLAGAVLAEDPACLLDTELHDGPADPSGELAAERTARVLVAREVCGSCPVRLPCLAYALRTQPPAGIWAGLTSDEITDLASGALGPAEGLAA